MKRNYFVWTALAFVLAFAISSCNKNEIEQKDPKITDENVTVTANSATFTWTVEWMGKRVSVVELSEHEDMSDSQFYGSEEELNKSEFMVTAHDLTPNTKYYYRFWVWNQNYINNKYVMGTKSFCTTEGLKVIISNVTVNAFSVTVDCNVVSDGGDNVTERGVCWSTSPNPEYNGSHLSCDSGTGTFSVELTGLEPETQYHVRAYAVNSADVAYSADLTFTTSAEPQTPTGTINGLFSVSETNKVWFSKGNLQYIGSASTPYWKFADNQWDYLGTSTSQNNTAPNVDRDLFGWGTSGYHDSGDPYNINYQPYSTNTSTVNSTYNYYGYGPSNSQSNPNITGTQYDWGVHNAIYNGGNQAGLWRTLTKDEWNYVFNERSASTVNGTPNARFAKGKVNNVYGVILFPDSYTHPAGITAPFGINDTGNTGWNYNAYSESDWGLMGSRGCVFLPAAGRRNWTSVSYMNSCGRYWSASHTGSGSAYIVNFDDSYLSPQNDYYRSHGHSVRLVRSVQ